MDKPLIAVVYGSMSDWETMSHAVNMLEIFDIPYHTQVISAHRTPQLLYHFANSCQEEGYEVVIAGAGGAAHLPGMLASLTLLPVLGVPIQTATLQGLDSLLSIVQMPGGVPVGTLAIGKSGAKNAALLAISILANKYPAIAQKWRDYRKSQTEVVLENLYPEKPK